MIYLELEAKAVGKARPRINTRTRQAYIPQKTKYFEDFVKLKFMKKYPNFDISDKPLNAKISILFAPPKSYSEKKKKELIGKPHTYKPDLDNIAKAILDSLNGLAYKDDSQIFKLQIEKRYAEKDLIILEINHEDEDFKMMF